MSFNLDKFLNGGNDEVYVKVVSYKNSEKTELTTGTAKVAKGITTLTTTIFDCSPYEVAVRGQKEPEDLSKQYIGIPLVICMPDLLWEKIKPLVEAHYYKQEMEELTTPGKSSKGNKAQLVRANVNPRVGLIFKLSALPTNFSMGTNPTTGLPSRNCIVDVGMDSFVKLCEGRDAVLMDQFLQDAEQSAQLAKEASNRALASAGLRNAKVNETEGKPLVGMTKRFISSLLGNAALEDVEERVR